MDISQGDASIERCRDEGVAERVRPDGLADAGAASDPSDNPGRAVPVQPAAIRSQEDRPFAAFTDGQIDRPRRARCQRDGDDLAAFSGDGQRPVAAFGAELCVPKTSSASCDQPIFVDQASDASVSSDAVLR